MHHFAANRSNIEQNLGPLWTEHGARRARPGGVQCSGLTALGVAGRRGRAGAAETARQGLGGGGALSTYPVTRTVPTAMMVSRNARDKLYATDGRIRLILAAEHESAKKTSPLLLRPSLFKFKLWGLRVADRISLACTLRPTGGGTVPLASHRDETWKTRAPPRILSRPEMRSQPCIVLRIAYLMKVVCTCNFPRHWAARSLEHPS